MILNRKYFALLSSILMAAGGFGLAMADSSLPTGDIDLDDQSEILLAIRGVDSDGRLGQGVVGGFDFNGDDFDDFAVAAPGSGKVYLIYGGRGDLFPSSGAANVDDLAEVAFSLPAAAGVSEHTALAFTDFDDDGLPDLVIGSAWYDASPSATDRGRVWVVYGDSEVLPSEVNLLDPGDVEVYTIRNDNGNNGMLGFSVSGGLDALGDGTQDLLIGAPGLSKAYLFYGDEERRTGSDAVGEASDVTFTGDVADRVGAHVSLSPSLSIVNTATVLISAPGTESTNSGDSIVDCGAVYLFWAPFAEGGQTVSESTKPTYSSGCAVGTDAFEIGTVAVGAYNHSGGLVTDLIIGAPGADMQSESGSTSETDTGALFFRYGSDSGLDAQAIGPASNAVPYLYGLDGDRLGSVGIAGDLDGDGRDDLIFGSPGSTQWDLGDGFHNASGGRVSIMLTSVNGVLPDDERKSVVDDEITDGIFFGATSGEQAGEAVALSGDLFRSGKQGLLIGAPRYGNDDKGRVYLYVVQDGVDGDNDGVSVHDGDCDDSDDGVNATNDEVCDGIDNDCDGQVDETLSTTWYEDSDQDGYGVESESVEACAQPDGYAAQSGDCFDYNASTYPNAEEICDDADNDCDGEPDENLGQAWYRDEDEDGYGDPDDSRDGCTQPVGYVSNEGDCDDSDPALNPETLWYFDSDLDGHGGGSSVNECDPGDSFVQNTGDCDDTDADRYPGNPEVCDTKDNNCDGVVPADEVDVDGDRFAECEGDCDESNQQINPNAVEICDTQDNDCDDDVDEGVEDTFYLDDDGDDYGDAGESTQACSAPNNYVEDDSDCDDDEALSYPGASEQCDGKDNNCDGSVPDTENNDDGDAFRVCEDDCDDADNKVYPGANEICDGKDSNCDGTGDDVVYDSDDDGHIDDSAGCPGDVIGSKKVDDCDDSDPFTYSGAPEICDDKDNDCDNTFDDEKGDNDGDGFSPCPVGGDPNTVDCDDGTTGATVYPGAPELCDGKLNNCDGNLALELRVPPENEEDSDDDGYMECDGCIGDDLCEDCDDSRDDVYPSAAESCDLADNDCDTVTDEGVLLTFYGDGDSDGSGDSADTTQACTAPNGYVDNDLDCDDSNDAIDGVAPEMACGDELDNDCDNVVDEELTGLSYLDEDNDGSGDPDTSLVYCLDEGVPDGYSDEAGDCDDSDGTIFEGLQEACDVKDNDCDGLIDEDFEDEDLIGGADCSDFDGDGDSEAQGDCDDGNDEIYVGAPELESNGIDNDCDGVVDEDADLDGDGELALANGGADCNDDPDNGGASSYPGAPELCTDSIDNNCDGLVNENCREPGFFSACSNTGSDGSGSVWGLLALALPLVLRRRFSLH